MIKNILTVGDSFTYGEELVDHNMVWPNRLANTLNAKVTNLGRPGKGNRSMIRNVVKNIECADLIIVAWSHYARIEFADNYGVYDTWPGNKGILFDGRLSYRHDLLKYITQYHNDEYLYRQYLLDIILLQNYLKSNNKNYLMLDAFGNTSLRHESTDLLQQIDTTYYIGWPNETMMEWTFGCPVGPRGHFLEQGHQRVADKIYEHIRNLGWVS